MSAKLAKWLPIVDPDLCTGCGRCVDACGPKSLVLRDGLAVLDNPGSCGSEEHCIEPCPESAIRMEWVNAHGDRQVGLWRMGS